MKKLLFLVLISIIISPVFLHASDTSDDEKNAMKLFWELIYKLNENTPFTLEDDEYFFGKLPNYNPTAMFYSKFGYIDFGKSIALEKAVILKPLPKLSFYGELLRMHRDKIISDVIPAVSYASKEYAVPKFNELIALRHFIGVFIFSKDKIIHMEYDLNRKHLITPIYINGVSLFYSLKYSNERHCDQFTMEKMAEIEKIILMEEDKDN